jgi:hypothetical protein
MQKLEESQEPKTTGELPEYADVHVKVDAVAQTLHKNGERQLAAVQDSPASISSKTTIQ